MRVMMLAQFYHPITGGEERHVQALCQALAMRGHDVSIVTQWHAGMAFTEQDDYGVRIYRVRALTQRFPHLFSNLGQQHAPPWPDPETSHALAAIIEREKPQIVHAHNWMVHAFLPLKRRSGAKLVLTLHDYGMVCPTKTLMYHGELCSGPAMTKCLECSVAHYGKLKGPPTLASSRVMRSIEARSVDVFLPVSQAVAEGTRLVNSRLPYEVIPNFVPDAVAEECAADDSRLNDLPKGDFLLYVGDLSVRKGVGVLLKAYAQTDGTLPPLVMIGRPAGVDQPLPPGVKVLHSWPHTAVMEAWRRSLFGIVPSIWPDPCPTVAMEAMATGRALVASRIGGLVDIVAHDETGFLLPPNDVLALETTLTLLATQPDLRQHMAKAARERASRFFASSVVPRIEQKYHDLLDN